MNGKGATDATLTITHPVKRARGARVVTSGTIRSGKARKKNDHDNNCTVPTMDVLNLWG